MEGPAFDIYKWEAALPDVHKSAAPKLSSMKPNISFHLVFCFPYWLSYSGIYQEDNPILQGAGVQQLRGLFRLWLQLILKLLCEKVQEIASCGWMYLHIWPMYNPMSAQCSVWSDLTWRKPAQVPNQVSTIFFLTFPCYLEWGIWTDWTSPTPLSSVFPQWVSVAAYLPCLGSRLETPVLLRLHVRSKDIQFLDRTPETWLLNVKHCSTLLLGS